MASCDVCGWLALIGESRPNDTRGGYTDACCHDCHTTCYASAHINDTCRSHARDDNDLHGTCVDDIHHDYDDVVDGGGDGISTSHCDSAHNPLL